MLIDQHHSEVLNGIGMLLTNRKGLNYGGRQGQHKQRFHFEGNFLLKGIFCKMKEI